MKRIWFLFAVAMLLAGGVACTREKPPAATPTLVNQPVLPSNLTPQPSGTGAPQGGSTIVVPNVTTGGGTVFPTATLPPSFNATAGPPPALATPTARSGQANATPVPQQVNPTAESGGSTAGGACPSVYVVKGGEWAYQIARKCGISFAQLQAANPGVNLTVVYAGQRLNIPGGR